MRNNDRLPFERTDDSSSLAIKIGVAVFIALLAAAAVRWLYVQWAIRQAAEEFQQSMVQMQSATQAQLAAIRERELVRQQQLAQARAQEIELQRRAREEESLRLQRQQELMIAKESAWKAFFKPKAECTNPRSNQEFVGCGNDYMRAKARFEKIWQDKLVTQD